MSKLFLYMFLFIIKLNAQNNIEYYINSAFQNNPVIVENNNILKISRLNKEIIKAQYNLPHISLTANYLFAPFLNNGNLISTNPDPEAIGYDAGITNGGLYSAQVNVEKNLFNSSIIDAYNNQTELQINSSKISIEKIKHELVRDITDQYLTCFLNQEHYLLSKLITDTLTQQLSITEALAKKGLAKQSDILLLKVELQNQVMASEQYNNTLKTNIISLNNLCGLKDNSIPKLEAAELDYTKTPANSNFLASLTIDSLNILNQQAISDTKYNPSLSVFFNAGLNAVELDKIQRKFGISAGVNFSLPLYDGNQKSLVEQQSEISLSTIRNNKEYQMIQIKNKLEDANEQIRFNTINLKSIKEQLVIYETILKLARAEHMRGELSIIEFLTIIRNYLELKKNEINATVRIQQSINQLNYWNW